MKTKRFITLRYAPDNLSVRVNIKRVHQFGWSQTYTLYPGDPSADRLWHILRDQSRTRYPAQLGWGSTPANNTARTVWCL